MVVIRIKMACFLLCRAADFADVPVVISVLLPLTAIAACFLLDMAGISGTGALVLTIFAGRPCAPVVAESGICSGKSVACADFTAFAGQVINRIVQAVRRCFQRLVILNLLIKDMCIELWPEELCLVLMDFQSNMIDKLCVRQPLLQQATGALDAVGKLATKFLQQNNVPLSLLRGVCISTPGIVDYRTSMLKFNALAPQWGNNIPIVDILRAYFGPDVMIVVENVGKLTARALLHDTALLKGQNLNDKRLLTVFTSWGLSGCLIDRGRIHNGKHALIGEFGHMTLEGSYPFRCGCGSSGCFEQVVGNAHIQMRISQECSMYPDSMLQTIPASAITVETIFDMSERGDELARKIDAELAQHFAVALRNISLNFDQECVVIQGIFSNADDYFKQQLNEKLMEFHYYFDNTPFEIQYDTRPIYKLDQMGAYAYMLDSYLSNSELYAGA